MSALRRMRGWMVEMKTCRQVGRTLQTYLDGELDREGAARAAVHLEHCRRCGLEVDAHMRIKESLARVASKGLIHPEDRLSIERLRRFAESL